MYVNLWREEYLILAASWIKVLLWLRGWRCLFLPCPEQRGRWLVLSYSAVVYFTGFSNQTCSSRSCVQDRWHKTGLRIATSLFAWAFFHRFFCRAHGSQKIAGLTGSRLNPCGSSNGSWKCQCFMFLRRGLWKSLFQGWLWSPWLQRAGGIYPAGEPRPWEGEDIVL